MIGWVLAGLFAGLDIALAVGYIKESRRNDRLMRSINDAYRIAQNLPETDGKKHHYSQYKAKGEKV